ncbi:putative endonuclease [Alteromonadaceae bacterium Bs31]|nr:putative endonuclease [Alteromonadaceae bacterium Bs31]
MAACWFVYVLRCCDNSLYTGVTTDVQRRLQEHNSTNKSARYTRARQPVSLVYQEEQANRSAACKREAQIKALTRAQKLELISAL